MNNIAEAIACKLSGHTICVRCGDCVECNTVEYDPSQSVRFAKPGHLVYDDRQYRCNTTYLRIGGKPYTSSTKWWSP